MGRYSVIHLHACGLHIVDACCTFQNRRKPLIVVGELSAAELDDFLGRLQPAGLAVFYWKPKERKS